MNIGRISDCLSILGFFLTLATFVAAINVRSQIVHLKERQNFKNEIKNISGILSGYVLSLEKNNLSEEIFFHRIDIYMTDLISKFTFFRISVKLRCKYISYLISRRNSYTGFNAKLAKQLTQLNNAILKEVDL